MQTPQPLLTNDVAGALKAIAALATLAVAITVGFWKIMSSDAVRDNKKAQGQIDGLGERVNNVAASDTRAHTRIDELVRRADVKDSEIRAVTGDIGRLEAKVDQTLSQGLENKLEIISAFTKIAGEMRDGLHSLDVKVEKLETKIDERDRMRGMA